MARYKINFANHTSLILNGMWQQFKREEGTDFEIMCAEGEVVKVHTWLMRIFLPHIRSSTFCSLDTVEKNNFLRVVEFLYKGELNVGPDELRDLKHAAETLNLKELRKALEIVCTAHRTSLKATPTSPRDKSKSTSPANSCVRKTQDLENKNPKSNTAKPNERNSTSTNSRPSIKKTTATVQPPIGVTQAFLKLKDASQLESFIKGNISIENIPDATLYFPVNPIAEQLTSHDVQLIQAPEESQVSQSYVSMVQNEAMPQTPKADEVTILKNVEEQNSAVQRLITIQDFDHDYAPRMDRLHSLVDETLGVDTRQDHLQTVIDYEEVAENVTVSSVKSDVKMPASSKAKKCKLSEDVESSETDWRLRKRKIKFAARFIFDMRCIKCEFIGKDNDDFMQHILVDHADFNPLDRQRRRCTECDYVSFNKKELMGHFKAHHKLLTDTKFQCELCAFAADKHVLLKRHVRNCHSTDRPFSCDQCDYRGTSKVNLKIHQEVHQERSFDCDLCDKTFKSRNYLRKHLRVHQCEVYECPICNLPLKLKSSLKKHLENVHNRIPIDIPSTSTGANSALFNTYTVKKIKCPLCEYNVAQKSFLVNHLAIKHQVDEHLRRIEPTIGCAECDFKCHVQSQLSIHSLRVHKKYKSKKPAPCTCDLCGISVSSKAHLKRHHDVIHNPNAVAYKCSMCEFATKTKQNLKVHLNRKHNATVVSG